MTDSRRERLVKVTLIQRETATASKEKTIEDVARRVSEAAEKERPDFMMVHELTTTQYFCSVTDTKYFDWAEPIPGPSTDRFGELAKKYEMCFLLGMFEKAPMEGIFYNSVVVIGPDGDIIQGTLPDGTTVQQVRKTHLPYNPMDASHYNERFYFREGNGWPVFSTPKAKIGVTICFDRHFPEPFRILSLQGAEIIFNPSNAMATVPERGSSLDAMYLCELQTHALENFVWVCATNQVGTEDVDGQLTTFYGKSCIIHPTGEIRVLASETESEVISCELDLEDVVMGRSRYLPFFRARIPKLYKKITEEY